MRRLNVDKASQIKVGAFLFAFVVLVVVGLLFLQKWEEARGRFGEQDVVPHSIEYRGDEYVMKKNIETLLIMVPDAYNGGVERQVDFLMLLVFDHDATQYTAIHINRDTMVDVNVLDVAGNKVNTLRKPIVFAYTYGNSRGTSCRNTVDSVCSLFKGIKVNHYLAIPLEGIAKLNDLVGGVQVTVLDDLSELDAALIPGKNVTLTGEQALKYIRTRDEEETGNNDRCLKRQQQYMNALCEAIRADAIADQGPLIEASLNVLQHMTSDCSVTRLKAFVEKMAQYEFTGIKNIDGVSTVGADFVEFYPKEESIDELVVECFYQRKK